jgi:peptide chain release factor 2
VGNEDKGEIERGSRIRSYVIHPYPMVKDHRTIEESGNLNAVLEGDLDDFMSAHMRSKRI